MKAVAAALLALFILVGLIVAFITVNVALDWIQAHGLPAHAVYGIAVILIAWACIYHEVRKRL